MTVALETKGVRLDNPSIMVTDADPEGTFSAIVSVTGVVDEVKDLIVPGAYTETLRKRTPKGIFTHDWNRWTAKTIAVEEWMPGDPRLPKTQRNGQPWPTQAGALVVKGQFNLGTAEGRDAHSNVKFFSEAGECEWSIGYQVPDGASFTKAGIRYIKSLDLYEYSNVLFGAAPLSTTLQVKDMLGGAAGITTASGGDSDLFGLGDDEELEPVEAPKRTYLADAKALVEVKSGPTHAGLAVQAADTGRILMLQRSMSDEDDPARGKWEFPGGGIEEGEQPHEGAMREFAEETGVDLPDGQMGGAWDSTNGIYRGHVYVVPSEGDVAINPGPDERAAINPDDPHGDNAETAAWFHPDDLPDMPSLRDEVRETPWGMFTKTARRGLCEKCGAPVLENKVCANGHGEETKGLPPVVKCENCGGKVNFGKCAKCGHRQSQKHKGDTAPAKDEAKASVPGGGADRNRGGAESLRKWYVSGEGAAKIRWGTPGDFMRCVRLAEKHMTPDHAKGYCNLRHREATGFAPGKDPGALAAAAVHGKSVYDPSMETGEFAGTMGVKMIEVPLAGEARSARLPGSYEVLRDAIQTGLSDLLNPVIADPDEDERLCEGGRAWNAVTIVATFDDEVVAQRIRWQGSDEVESFQVPFICDGETVTLGDPVPVRLVQNTQVQPMPYGLGPDAPLVDQVEEVAERIAAMLGLTLDSEDEDDEDPAEEASESPDQEVSEATANPDCDYCGTSCVGAGCPCPCHDDDENATDPAEGPAYGYTPEGVETKTRRREVKAGRVLSAANEARMRAAAEHLIAVLAAAGIDIGHKPTQARDGVADPMADTTTTARPDDGILATEMKDLLAQAATLNAYVLTEGQ
jgi:8-oxo-dGTP pyrophosphatase MutT (NUDIX family)